MSTIHACLQPNQPVNVDTLKHMLSASDYWQPDASSQMMNATKICGMAKASLWNTVYSKEDEVYQDFRTKDIISANARIDNRLQLIHQLNLAKDTPDNQIILAAYQKWKQDCPKYLLGDFVFIVWDEQKQQLFCARDHFGIKVLLYSTTNQGVMISNEPNAFFTSKWIEKRLKEKWLVELIWGLSPRPPETAYQQLEILPPAHTMLISSTGAIQIKRYWDLEDSEQWLNQPHEVLFSQLKKTFQLAVRDRLISDYPLACELSEGVDSNAIAGMAAKLQSETHIHTLSYQCQVLNEETAPIYEKTYQDIFEMLKMHPNLKPIWTERTFDPETPKDYVNNIGGTLALKGVFRWHCELAQQKNARVLLSGWGGDHCVTNYGDFYEDELLTGFKWVKLYQLLKAKHKRGRGGHPIKSTLALILKHSAPSLYQKRIRQRQGLEAALWERTQFSFLKQEWIEKYDLLNQLQTFTDGYRKKSVKAHHRRELFDIGVEGRLIDSELCARMHRMEFRFPMLDVRLVEMVYNFPSELKVYKGIERYHFRKIMNDLTTNRNQWRLKADVQHPNIDHFTTLNATQLLQLQSLLNTHLLRSYCHHTPLNCSNPHAQLITQTLKKYRYFLEYYVNLT